ncbi:spore coat protein [bacterium]|nr:MAG: spore coat protein [bacterium]
MKGMILAGGLGTRLRPMTLVTNKHLLPVYDQPMVYYPIKCLVNAGITEIMIVTGEENAGDFIKLLRDGKELGLTRLEYAFQVGEGGIADALKLGKYFVDDDKVCVILGDNIIENNINDAVEDFRNQKDGAKVLLKEVHDPERFGVVEFGDDGKTIVNIIEKPTNPPSNMAVTGLYMYDSDVFNICETLKPSSRNELEITDVNTEYLRRGNLTSATLEGWWTDAGTIESLHRASNLIAESGANKV